MHRKRDPPVQRQDEQLQRGVRAADVEQGRRAELPDRVLRVLQRAQKIQFLLCAGHAHVQYAHLLRPRRVGNRAFRILIRQRFVHDADRVRIFQSHAELGFGDQLLLFVPAVVLRAETRVKHDRELKSFRAVHGHDTHDVRRDRFGFAQILRLPDALHKAQESVNAADARRVAFPGHAHQRIEVVDALIAARQDADHLAVMRFVEDALDEIGKRDPAGQRRIAFDRV